VCSRYIAAVATADSNTFNNRVTIYAWLDADLPSSSGSYAVQATTPKADAISICCMSFTGVVQQAEEAEVWARDTAGPSSVSTNITPLTDGALIVDGWMFDLSSLVTCTAGTNQVERQDQHVWWLNAKVSTKIVASAGLTSMSWTMDAGGPASFAVHYVAAWAAVADDNNAALVGCNF